MALDSTLHRLFCQNLKAVRVSKSLTQEVVAERMGITQSTYNGIEKGRFEPTLGTIEKISVALGCAPADLLVSEKIPTAV